MTLRRRLSCPLRICRAFVSDTSRIIAVTDVRGRARGAHPGHVDPQHAVSRSRRRSGRGMHFATHLRDAGSASSRRQRPAPVRGAGAHAAADPVPPGSGQGAGGAWERGGGVGECRVPESKRRRASVGCNYSGLAAGVRSVELFGDPSPQGDVDLRARPRRAVRRVRWRSPGSPPGSLRSAGARARPGARVPTPSVEACQISVDRCAAARPAGSARDADLVHDECVSARTIPSPAVGSGDRGSLACEATRYRADRAAGARRTGRSSSSDRARGTHEPPLRRKRLRRDLGLAGERMPGAATTISWQRRNGTARDRLGGGPGGDRARCLPGGAPAVGEGGAGDRLDPQFQVRHPGR